MFADLLACDGPWLGQQGERFRSSLDGAGFNTSGTIAHALFSNQHEQSASLVLAVVARVMIPGNPELQRVFEA